MEEPSNHMVGELILCRNEDDAIYIKVKLELQGIETVYDNRYEGIWLRVVAIDE